MVTGLDREALRATLDELVPDWPQLTAEEVESRLASRPDTDEPIIEVVEIVEFVYDLKRRNGSVPAPARARRKPAAAKPKLEALPPQNLDAEESVLGALMLSNCPTSEVLALVEAGDFYRESHATIFRAIVALHKRAVPVDGLTVVDELGRRGDLGQAAGMEVDGAARVHELAALVPAASNAPHYARIVREAASRRRLAALHERGRAAALDEAVDLDEAIASAEAALSAVAERRTAATRPLQGLTHTAVLALELPPERHLIRDLIPAAAVGTIAGVPETYKSWLAQAIAVRVAAGEGTVLGCEIVQRGRVGYFWQDDSTAEETARVKAFHELHPTTPDAQLHWFLNAGVALPADLSALHATVVALDLDLVVLDSLYNFLPGIDLKDEGAEQIVARLKREIADTTGCAVLIVDHMPWATDSNRQRLRAYGGVFKNAATRYGIYIDAAGTKLSIEARGNNIRGFKKTPAYWDADRLELRLIETADHDEAIEHLAEQLLAYLTEHPESHSVTSLTKAMQKRDNTVIEALELLKARAVVLDHGRDGGPWSGKKGTPHLWIASIHAASHGIQTTAQLFGPDSAAVAAGAVEEEPRPAPYKGAVVSAAVVDEEEIERLAAIAEDIL